MLTSDRENYARLLPRDLPFSSKWKEMSSREQIASSIEKMRISLWSRENDLSAECRIILLQRGSISAERERERERREKDDQSAENGMVPLQRVESAESENLFLERVPPCR